MHTLTIKKVNDEIVISGMDLEKITLMSTTDGLFAIDVHTADKLKKKVSGEVHSGGVITGKAADTLENELGDDTELYFALHSDGLYHEM